MSEYIVDFGNSMAMLSRIIESPSAWLCGEIVRCRDCAYYDGEPDMESMGEKCWRDPSHSGRSIPTVADGFCWRGERKEGGE